MKTAEAVVRLFIEEMWGTGNTDLVDVVVSPDYRPDGQDGGREFVRRNMVRFRAAFPDMTVRLLHLVADESRGEVGVLFEISGTHRGVFGGIEPTGRSIRMREAGFFTVEDGMVVAADWVSDSLGLRIQLGALPEDFWTNPSRR